MTEIENFFYNIKMHPALTDIASITDGFLDEMRRGLCDEPSSLKMIPTYISAHGTALENESVVAIDAGGTNLRFAKVTCREGTPVVENLEIIPMPGSREEISATEVFDVIADKILPLCKESAHISFCLSYPAEIFENRDGRLGGFNKELKVNGAEGLIIGETLIKALRNRGLNHEMSFTLLNDTTASLLGTASEGEVGAGLIVGTGFNCCYTERGENIKKLKKPFDMIVNCESGMFDKLIRGETDRFVDEQSDIPGDHLLEKMVSGAYLGKLFSHTARLAAIEGFMTPAFAGDYKPFNTKELDDFLRGAHNRVWGMCRGRDEVLVRYITDMIFERAARLVCSVIAALCLYCDGGKDSKHPFKIAAEGSVFDKSLFFTQKLEKHVDNHIYMNLSRYVSFHTAENATLVGAALAALQIKNQ